MDELRFNTQLTSLPDIEPLQLLLHSVLQDGSAHKEHELISWLQQQGVLRHDALQDSLSLFRCHFIIMHCLYRLQAQWFDDHSAWLEISPLCIQRHPYSKAVPSERSLPASNDGHALASYYLDLSQLATTRADIDELLSSFWRQMAISDYRQADLDLLQLPPQANAHDIRQRYRFLAMQHHPDRGGDTGYFQQLTTAYQRLRNSV